MNHATERLFELDTVSQSVADAVPSRIKEAIDHFVWWGRPTGDFVKAVLENRLRESIGRADEGSLAAIKEICCYVHNAVPSGCHGSPEAVEAHLIKGRALQRALEEDDG